MTLHHKANQGTRIMENTLNDGVKGMYFKAIEVLGQSQDGYLTRLCLDRILALPRDYRKTWLK
jgi:hypothetical protein